MARTTGTVSLGDLVSQGVLTLGERIVIRRRSAAAIEATISADGSILVGEANFSTPSAAARRVLDVQTVDGWLRWRVPRLGDRTLADIRGNR